MLRTFAIAFFPFWMLCLEALVRLIASMNVSNCLGPSLASIGLGFIVPVLERPPGPYPITDAEVVRLNRQGYRVSSRFNDRMEDIAFFSMGAGILLWLLSLYFADKKATELLWSAPWSFWPGLLTAVAGTVLYLVKLMKPEHA